MREEKDVIDRLVEEWNRESPELNCQAMHVVGRIIKLGKVLEKRASSTLKESGIHYTDLDALATIRRSGKPYELSPKQLMQSVLITSGAMTALLDRLTKLDLVYRTSDANDGRVKLVGLTEKGFEVIDKAIVLRFEEASEAVENLTTKEHNELTTLLKKLLAQLEDMSDTKSTKKR